MIRLRPLSSCPLVLVPIYLSLALGSSLRAQSENANSANTESGQESIEQLIRQLDSQVANERILAAQQLCVKGKVAQHAIPKLIELLGDETQAQLDGSTLALRYHMRRLFIQMGSVATDAMLDALAHKNRLVRMSAAEVLGGLRAARAVDALIERLNDGDGEVASYASTALVNIGEASIDPLLKVLGGDNTSTRQRAAGALGSIRNERAVRPVAKLLFDSDSKTREWAVESLYRLAFSHPLGTVWPPAVDPKDEKAVKAREKNDAALRKIVCDELNLALVSDNLAAQLAATQCCRRVMAVENREALAKCLSAKEATLREQSVQAIMIIHDASVLKLLLQTLSADSSADVRAAAANGLRYRASGLGNGDFLVEPLTKALSDDDRRVRFNAAEGLAVTPSRQRGKAVLVLIKLLNDSDLEVAAAAIHALTEIRDKQAVEPLHDLLQKPRLRVKAAVALASFRDGRVLELLRGLLKDKDPNVVRAIGLLRDRESVYPLIALLGEKDHSIRREAAAALGEIGDIRAVEPLADALQSDRDLLHAVADALVKIKHPYAVWPLINAARTHDFRGQGFRFRADFAELGEDPQHNPVAWPLYHMGAVAIEPLANSLTDQSQAVRGVAAWVLYNLTSQGEGIEPEDFAPAIEPLAAALTDESTVVRFHAAMALGNLKDARAIDVLIEVAAASDNRSFVYQNAAGLLSGIRDPRAVAPLIGLLKDARPKVRITAINGLAWMREKSAAEPILALLEDHDPTVIAAAAEGLGNLKAREAIEPLKKLLQAKNATTRIGAAKGLGRLGDSSAADAIAKLESDKEFQVRVAAAVALLRLKDSRGLDLIAKCLKDPEEQNREHAATELSSSFLKRDDGLINVLKEALDDPSIRVRLYAAGALGHIGNKAAVDVLVPKISHRENLRSVLQAIIQSKDSRAFDIAARHLDDEEVKIRCVAAFGLGELNPPAGTDLLIKRLNDPAAEVRNAVIDSLAKLRAESALEALKRALGDESPDVRSHAARAIKRIELQQSP